MREERFEHLLEVEQAWLAIDQRHHVHAEGVLELRLLVQVVEHDLGHFAALEFDHDTHALLVGFVSDIGDAFDLLFADQFGDALELRALVHLVGQFVDDDRLATCPCPCPRNAFVRA